MRVIRARIHADDPGRLAFFTRRTGLIYFSLWRLYLRHPKTLFPDHRRKPSALRDWIFF